MDSLQCLKCRNGPRSTEFTYHHELRQGRRRAFVCRYLVSRLYTLNLGLLTSVFGLICPTSPVNYGSIQIRVGRIVFSELAVLILWQDDYGNTPHANQGMIGHPEYTPRKYIHVTFPGVDEYLVKSLSKLIINPCILKIFLHYRGSICNEWLILCHPFVAEKRSLSHPRDQNTNERTHPAPPHIPRSPACRLYSPATTLVLQIQRYISFCRPTAHGHIWDNYFSCMFFTHDI
jgi:hypothetical protein